MSSKLQMAYRRPESVLVLIYTLDLQVLLLERTHPQGFWQSVTGSLEWDESAQDCAQRELFEETGIQQCPENTGIINRFKILPQFSKRYAPDVDENIEYLFTVVLSHKCDIKLSPQEHTTYQWLDARTAQQKCFSQTNAEAIVRFVREQVE